MISQRVESNQDAVRVDDIQINLQKQKKSNKELVIQDFDDFDQRKQPMKLRGLNDDDEDELSPNNLGLKRNSSCPQIEEQLLGILLQKAISQVRIIGFNSNCMQAVTNLSLFLNDSFLFKTQPGFEVEANELDMQTASLLLSSKRSLQASEVLRKLQAKIIARIRQSGKADSDMTKKLFLKASVLEIMCAEAFSLPNQTNEKIQSLKRATQLFQCQTVEFQSFQKQIMVSECAYTSLSRQMPHVLKCILSCLNHRKQVVRICAIKNLEFLLINLGCSLDQSLQLILKTLLGTYPSKNSCETNKNGESFTSSDSSQQSPQISHDEPAKLHEPSSGFPAMIKNAYNHVIDTFTQVLSSVSSHILHQLFYDVILPVITSDSAQNQNSDVKGIAVKIAEKVINICQGDLILNTKTLDIFLNFKVKEDSHGQAFKSIWSSIRSKVFTHYSQTSLKLLVDWVADKMNTISIENKRDSISCIELTDEDMNKLVTLVDLCSVLAVSRKKNDEEANQLIKINQEACPELYGIVHPLIFWLEFSVERNDRLSLFKSIYATFKEVNSVLPANHGMRVDLASLIYPIIHRTSLHLKSNSPTQNTLKFLELILKDFGQSKSMPEEVIHLFLELLSSFVPYISFAIYEDVFPIFDKLLAICATVLDENIFLKCLSSLIERYNFKNKSQKQSLQGLTKILINVEVTEKKVQQQHNNNLESMEDDYSMHSMNNFFEVMCDFCFFNNEDVTHSHSEKDIEFRTAADLHEIYCDKLQYFIDTLSQLNELHTHLFLFLTTHPSFKNKLVGLLHSSEFSMRLKAHEILEQVTTYYCNFISPQTRYEFNGQPGQPVQHMEGEYISHERLFLAQVVAQCARISLETKNDAYMQFNGLLLLDTLFQQLLPVPSYLNETIKGKTGSKNQNQSGHIDIETIEISDQTPEVSLLCSLKV